MFTCVVNDTPEAIVGWRRNGMNGVGIQIDQQVASSFPDFTLNITYYNATSRELVSTATSQSAASTQLNGSISCSADGINYTKLTINITGMYKIITWNIIN